MPNSNCLAIPDVTNHFASGHNVYYLPLGRDLPRPSEFQGPAPFELIKVLAEKLEIGAALF